MILFDQTKAGSGGPMSGLSRVGRRLLASLPEGTARAVSWAGREGWAPRIDDWFFTPELFSEAERPGLRDFLARPPCRTAALFHDAIPLRLPAITWPQSVARHPEYMKLLSRFDRVLAVSQASREELLAFWRWLGLPRTPPVIVLPLGSDFDGRPRAAAPSEPAGTPLFLSTGIIEPRKNQELLLEACVPLWEQGLRFELHLAGRVNPHFGKPIAERVKSLRRRHPGLHLHTRIGDAELGALLDRATATLFPSIAEGCGLPLLESLWGGVPCLCSDIPALRENAAAGGAQVLPRSDPAAWREALRGLLADPARRRSLAAEACARPLASWADSAAALVQALL